MSLFKSASTISLLTFASRILGLVRELLIASTFGASIFTDAFNYAFRLPNFFRRLFAEGAFTQAFVPVLASVRETEGDEKTKNMLNQVATVLFWLVLAFSMLGVLAAPLMVFIIASGLKRFPEGYAATVTMTRWIFPYIGFMSMTAFAAGVLNTWRKFAVPAAAPIFLNITMITAAWLGAPLFKQWGIQPIYALCVGVMVGGVLQLGTQLIGLHRLNLLPRIGTTPSAIRSALFNPYTRRIANLMLPAIFGVSVAQLSLLINSQIASYLAPGSASWLSYADRLMEFPAALLGVAMGVVLMPQLSSAQAKGDQQAYSSMLDWALRYIMLMSLPCAVALLTFARPMVSVIYQSGAFAARDVEQTSLALMGYGTGLVGLIAIKILAPAYYARQDIKTPVKVAIGVLVFTQCLNFIFVPILAVGGLSLSIGLASLCNAGMLLFLLLRRGLYKPEKGWGLFMVRLIAATLIMMAFLLWAEESLEWVTLHNRIYKTLQFVGIVIAAACIYFGVLWISGMKLLAQFRR